MALTIVIPLAFVLFVLTSIFAIFHCKRKHGHSLVTRQTNTRTTTTVVRRFQPMDNPAYSQHPLPTLGGRAQAPPPTHQETLISTEPPSYSAVQENQDLYSVTESLPPSYPATSHLGTPPPS